MDIEDSSRTWDKVKTDRLVNEYLLCKGLFESGDLLASHSTLKVNIGSLLSIDLL